MSKRKRDADVPLHRSIGTHEVFISHRGIDMKRTFASHLYHSLEQRGIKAFLDMEELPEGHDVRPFMLEAARRAIIQVPIFTSAYAESRWCLDELVEMVKSTKSSSHAKVFPVFYDVKPEELQNKDGTFAKAIKAHREEGKHSEDTIKGWEDAVRDASGLEGFRLETYNKAEGKLVRDLVAKIVEEIQDRTLQPNAVALDPPTVSKTKKDANLPMDRSNETYEVFISHDGTDMKFKLANHLYHSLEQRGIQAFLDTEDLPEEQDVRPPEAVQGAIIKVPVFTSSYAKSRCCLDELVEVMKSTKSSSKAKLVLPVFYNVKSEHLRKEDGPFGEAIQAHRERGMHDEDTIKGWEDALYHASWLEGFRLETYNECEGKLVKDLVAKIVEEMQDRTTVQEDRNAVGLEERLRDLLELFHLKEKRTVYFVLLWGMGGIGKTTLARAVYRRLGKVFEAASLVENCGDQKPSQIQDRLFQDLLLLEKDFRSDDVEKRKQRLKLDLSQKEVLIILDDVKPNFDSIEKVIDLTSLHPGSRILVTSRDQRVFPHENDFSDVFRGERYELPCMDNDKSLRLFCLHAFRKNRPDLGFESLAMRVSQACGGLPLSLEVLGRHLSMRKEKEIWEEAISMLRSSKYQGISGRLMISYEALTEDEQEMFLDVACFLIGQHEQRAKYFWDGLVEGWRIGLKRLVELCLVKVVKVVKFDSLRGEDKEELLAMHMHDHLRDLGRSIVRMEYKKSGKWSRLWDDEDLSLVLQRNQGLDQIRGLVTSLPNLKTGSLSQMQSLRLLFLVGTRLDGGDSGGLKGLPIRWLKLNFSYGAPPIDLDSLDLDSLTVLEMNWSNGTIAWSLIQKTLRTLDMAGCVRLEELPEGLGCLESLEELDVGGCAAITKLLEGLRTYMAQKLKKLRWPHEFELMGFKESGRL